MVYLDITPGSQRGDAVVEMSVGDPRRKNTVCVEIRPLSLEVRASVSGLLFARLVGAGIGAPGCTSSA